jgi:hypothetical protein
VAVTAAERMRALRRRRAEARSAAARAAAAAAEAEGLRGAIETRAVQQLEAIDQALVAAGGIASGPLAERALAGTKELLLRAFGNPLIRMAELAAADTRKLATMMGAQPLEVRRLQHQADGELADRLFGKAPLAIRNEGGPALAIQLAVTPGLAAQIGMRVVESEQDQRLDGGGDA